MAKQLGPCKNGRVVRPRNCETCKYLEYKNGWVECMRPDGPSFDTGNGDYRFWVCDGWADSTWMAGPLYEPEMK